MPMRARRNNWPNSLRRLRHNRRYGRRCRSELRLVHVAARPGREAASSVPGSDARAIVNGGALPPKGDKAMQIFADLTYVQSDAEGDISPPDGFGTEVGQVKLDCEDGL